MDKWEQMSCLVEAMKDLHYHLNGKYDYALVKEGAYAQYKKLRAHRHMPITIQNVLRHMREVK